MGNLGLVESTPAKNRNHDQPRGSSSSFFEHLEAASKIVASWPEWKRKGSDVVQFSQQ